MVRGINKRIIEINDTQNPYFERAVLYLKDNQADSSKKHWKHRPRVFWGIYGHQNLHSCVRV